MKITRRKKILILSVALIGFFAAASSGLAQDAMDEAATTVGDTVLLTTASNFFVAIIAGIALTGAFALVLTNLSIALGMNVAGASMERRSAYGRSDIKTDGSRAEAYDDSEHDPRYHGDKKSSGGPDPRDTDVHGKARMVTAGFGIWTLITTSVALFFASWLSVLVSGTFSILFGAVMGLVIWGLFYLIMVSLESSALFSLVGSLARTGRTAMQSASSAASGALSSQEKPGEASKGAAQKAGSQIKQKGEEMVHRLREVDTEKAKEHAALGAKTAAAASWWIFAAAIVSGGAAVVGGMIPAL
jgi:hypothetical protein